MNKLYFACAIAAVMATASSVDAEAAGMRLPIQEDKPVEMYALGASGTTGVWQLNLTDFQNSTKISGSTYVQYAGTALGGGGTFLNTETVVGVKYGYSAYPFEATAEGNGDGPWSESYFKQSYNVDKVYDMTYDEQSDVIYCWFAVNSYNNALGIYDKASHTITRVGSAPNTALYALAIDNEGQLWGIGTYGLIYKVDKTTGKATEMTGSMGCGVQFANNFPMSAAIDPASNMMYVVAKASTYDTASSLAKVDLTTYKAENLGKLPGFFNCLYIAGSTISDGAPAPVEGLSAEFNGTETVVTFTAPTQTAGGKVLSGALTYTIKVDGEEAATGSVNAGETVNVAITPADGAHEIQVSVANAEGASKEVKTNVYSGYDTPGSISNLKATVEGTTVTLTWDAPEGANGGLLDTEKISYKVSRNGEVVAEGLTSTTTENVLDVPYAQYTYAVTVMYGEEECQSNTVSIFAGVPYAMPYALDLASVTSLGEAGIEVLDPNYKNSRASETWKLESSDDEAYLSTYKQSYFYQSDFAYLPAMELKAGVDYTLTFNGRATTTAYGSYKATLSVVIADKATDAEGEYTSLESFEIIPVREYYDWTEYSVSFTVAQDGVYNLAFLAWDQDDMYGNYYVNVKNIAVAPHFVIPNPVSDLEVAAQEDNVRNIEISFVLPTESTEGKELTSITKVEIRRGTEVIETIEADLTPGEKVNYVDENAPRGIRSYSVVVYCDDQASKVETASVKVGYVNNLVVTALSWPVEPILLDQFGTILVEVTNDGFENVLEGAYEVVLMADGVEVESQTGLALATDQTEMYSFTLNYAGTRPATVEYKVKVVFNGDEKLDDNETAPILVNFSNINSVSDAIAEGANAQVVAAAGVIRVKGAAGEAVIVATADGRVVAAGITDGEFHTAPLATGIYVVKVGTKSVKIAL